MLWDSYLASLFLIKQSLHIYMYIPLGTAIFVLLMAWCFSIIVDYPLHSGKFATYLCRSNASVKRRRFSSLCICLSFVCLLATLRKKRANRFTWKLQDMSDLVQGTIWNILGMFRLTPCIQEYNFRFFRGSPRLLATLRKNEWMHIHESWGRFEYVTRNNLH